jgi:hypothetical protein
LWGCPIIEISIHPCNLGFGTLEDLHVGFEDRGEWRKSVKEFYSASEAVKELVDWN